LGEHTAEIFRDRLGIDETELAELKTNGVI
ncbi:hypothetical protein SAMN05216215_11252, partial [Saccharopolyspora shandongensis]